MKYLSQPQVWMIGILLAGLFLLIFQFLSARQDGNERAEEMITVGYEIPPILMTLPPPSDGVSISKRKTAQEQMIEVGVTFPEGSMVLYNLSYSGTAMYNTRENHKKFRKWLTSQYGNDWRIHQDREDGFFEKVQARVKAFFSRFIHEW